MATLYELTAEYLELLKMASDPDVDPEVLADTMEGMEGELEDKADGYAKVIRTLEGDCTVLDGEIKRLTARKKAVETNVKRIKESLQAAMVATGKTKFKTQLFSFGIQKNPASVVMDTEDLSDIDPKYWVIAQPTIDKKAIAADLKAGVVMEGVAHLEQGESLRIR